MSKAKQQKEEEKKDKEKISRVSRSQQKQTKKKRRSIFIVILAVIVVLGTGAVFNLPYINVVRRGGEWLADKIRTPSGNQENDPEYQLLIQPQSGKVLSGIVSSLIVTYKGSGPDRVILGLALFNYDTDLKEGEIYILSEGATAYDAAGQKIDLSQALKNEGGPDLLRNTAGNIAGVDIDYLVLMGFDGAARMVQQLVLPPLLFSDNVVVTNPVNGDVSHLSKGQETGDADRIVSYLLAFDSGMRREARLERAQGYLPEVLYALHGQTVDKLAGQISGMGSELSLIPANKTQAEDDRYVASMLQAMATVPLMIKAVPRVEVLNGCGIPDLGKRVGDRLASLGVLVGGTGGNAKVVVDGQEFNDFSHQKSSIIYRRDDPRVKAYAQYLGVLISVDEIVYDSNPGPDLVIIVGKDKA
ncbi:MAG: hypothetical protein A2V52_04890 [Actinobacteria bacterium RBG_19FT_COMBO_54_7]|nr:MAG: hypothetical protein A2V52_04890 [Actinobacteria bacterium RBG_19FT_COMBO_54_7]